MAEEEQEGQSSKTDELESLLGLSSFAPMLLGVASLPKAFEQHPQGAKVLIRLVFAVVAYLIVHQVCGVLGIYFRYNAS